ncbi:methyltransferase domain-containing protein [Marinilactibacillus kalidii]|uniref:methyltransferase domain-containing protein n=1 Tax=Marinilactibacillus kalidii TaxID=2820274 RepID=UPI001ABED335|nr:methyltransferase domain-containing protein [Marinilactibacillus kalidii]
MKKIEKSAQFLESNRMLFQCPVCGKGFTQVNNNQFICESNHSFDLSKKGSIHFLLKQPHNDYDTDMLKYRRIVAQDELWHPMLAEVSKYITNQSGVHLDVGCGEGSHLHHLQALGLKGTSIGFDISKDAIQLAAALYTDVFWSVADLAQSPFATASYDTIFNILSPSNYSEFDRLLKKGGQVIKVIPSENYLIEIRELTGKNLIPYSNQDVIEKFYEHYPNAIRTSVSYKHEVKASIVQPLLNMTPLSWNSKQSLEEIQLEEVSIDMDILIGNKG